MIFNKVRIFARFPSFKKKQPSIFQAVSPAVFKWGSSIHCHPQPGSTSSPKARSNLLLFCSSLFFKKHPQLGGWTDTLVKIYAPRIGSFPHDKGESISKKWNHHRFDEEILWAGFQSCSPQQGLWYPVGGGFWPILSIHLGCGAHTLVHSGVHG